MKPDKYIMKIKTRIDNAHLLLDKHRRNENWGECLVQEGKILAYEMILRDWGEIVEINK